MSQAQTTKQSVQYPLQQPDPPKEPSLLKFEDVIMHHATPKRDVKNQLASIVTVGLIRVPPPVFTLCSDINDFPELGLRMAPSSNSDKATTRRWSCMILFSYTLALNLLSNYDIIQTKC